MHQFLVHKRGDHVGVATVDIEAGASVVGVYMDDNTTIEIKANSEIPLGHKIALVNHRQNEDVIEYGQVIGMTSELWSIGDYVHTHNIRTKRW